VAVIPHTGDLVRNLLHRIPLPARIRSEKLFAAPGSLTIA